MTFLSDTDPHSCDGGRDWGIEESAGRGTIVGTHVGVVERLLGDGIDRKEFLVVYSWLSASASSYNSEARFLAKLGAHGFSQTGWPSVKPQIYLPQPISALGSQISAAAMHESFTWVLGFQKLRSVDGQSLIIFYILKIKVLTIEF